MSVLATPPVNPFQPPPGPVWRFGVADYHRLIASGVLGEDDRVELLGGGLVVRIRNNPLHFGTIQTVTETLRSALPQGWTIRVQSARTTNDIEPETDVAVVRGDSRAFLHRHPGPTDVCLIV